MDYEAEQQMEIEALEAIMMDDLEELDENQWPSGWNVNRCWRVAIVPTDDGEPLDTSDDALRMELVFAHTPSYPDEPPMFKPRSVRGIADKDLAELSQQLGEVAQENLGMAMVFNLVTAAQEWLREKVSATVEEVLTPEEARKRKEEEEERRIADMRRYGTPVTPESFNAWLDNFRAEQALEKARLEESVAAEKKDRLTGRKWFQQQEQSGVEVSEEPDDDEEEYREEMRRDEAKRQEQRYRQQEEQGEDDEEEIDEEDLEDEDEDDFLDEYLAEKA